MIAPQFSLRWILAVTAVCGFVSLIAAAALRGAPWAAAVVIALGALLLILAVHGLMFFMLWLFSLLLPGSRSVASGHSPFASSTATES